MELNEFLRKKASSVERMRLSFRGLQFLYNLIVIPLRALSFIATGVLFIITLFIIIPFGFWGFGCLILYFILTAIPKPRNVYESRIKDKIIPTIIEKTDPNLKYYPYHINYETIKKSGLFNKSFFATYISLTGDDLIQGKVDGVDVEFGEICFKKEYVNWFKTILLILFALILIPIIIIAQLFGGEGSGNIDELPIGLVKETKIFYQGMYMSADFHKHFSGQVLLMPKNLENINDKLDDYFFGTTFKKITVENPLINQAYNVLGTNEQTAFYVLSPAIIQAIEHLHQQEKKWPVVSFQNGTIFLTVPNSRNYFAANLKKKVKDETYFTRYIDELHSLKKMVKDFNLDTRIWTKS
ncbi:hypothetical protein GCM10011344_14300 [Dokdonia pacifica]|uniref:DUF3137 domain-containing protein n=1 Tax=Dokdonia pacifica TaxID=1627892 RepID=A0A238W5R6_9FLAO|nr:DUF3137 domain-containing protein [Dokdonia pacifica]GGG14828.1 hypothetical protein GCM10011344_14300 [Dokdonia pacifica]SNR41838.1 Protein of unknown function [Dokdonia pacifica]